MGGALLDAKQQYFNSLAAGSLSVYDESVGRDDALWAAPEKVEMPNQTNVDPNGTAGGAQSSAVIDTTWWPRTATPRHSFPYRGWIKRPSIWHSTTRSKHGAWWILSDSGGIDLYQTAERPILPLTVNRDSPDKVARGVLMLGGI